MTDRTIAWIGLVVAILAILVSLGAFNRAGTALEANQTGTVTNIQDQLSRGFANLEARGRLMYARILAQNNNFDEAANQVNEAKQSLDNAYQSASGTARDELNNVDSQLTQIGDNLKNKSSDAINKLDDLSTTIRDNLNATIQ